MIVHEVNVVTGEQISREMTHEEIAALPGEQPVLPPTKSDQEARRQAAYIAEADPLFFKWQAGEATEAEWKAKRQEIRDRFPYPVE